MEVRTLPAISLWQPWASVLFVPSLKPIETRHWSTNYRGPLLIHAAKKSNGELVRFWNERRNDKRFAWDLAASGLHGFAGLPLGAIIGRVDLVDCVETATTNPLGMGEPLRVEQNRLRFEKFCVPNMWPIVEMWGDFSPGRFGWCFANARRLTRPIPYRGAQGFFNVEADILPDSI
jgi:hypothetical protein